MPAYSVTNPLLRSVRFIDYILTKNFWVVNTSFEKELKTGNSPARNFALAAKSVRALLLRFFYLGHRPRLSGSCGNEAWGSV